MKRVLFIIAVLLCAPQSVSAASLAKAPNNLGLVGYWSFNEGTGLKAGDNSGNGNTGTLTGGPTWSGGKFGGGLTFDGVNDKMTIPVTGSYVAKGNLGFASSESFTISLLYKGTDTSGGHASVGKGLLVIPDGTVWAGLVMFNGYPEFAHYNAGWSHNIRSSVNIADNRWHQVAYVNENDIGWLYVDGVAVVSGVSSVIETGKYFQPSAVAAGYNGEFTSGSIDEVRIYSRALGANEIARLYNAGGVGKIQSAQSEAGTGLVGHWKLDDRAGTRATDSSGRGNNGTLTNFALAGATSNWISGRWGGGLNFDGVDDYISFSPMTPTTVAFWQKTTGDAFILGNGPTPNRQIRVGQSGANVMSIYDGANNPQSNTLSVARGQWSHLVYVFTGGSVFFYENGIAKGSGTGNPIELRTLGSRTGTQEFISGSLDDVRLYSTALTAEQVKTLYASGTSRPAIANANSASLTAGTNLASGLVGHWSFDGRYLSTTTARDTSGQGNHGTLTNGPAPVIGKMGQALSFDGSDDYAETPSSSLYGYGTGDFTWSTWIYPTNLADSYEMIWAQGTGIPYVALNGSKLHFYVSGVFETTDGYITANTWQHVVVTRTSGIIRLYRNGVVYGSNSSQAASIAAGVGTIGRYGTACAGGCHSFHGSMDDVRIYDRALSVTEVKQLYYLGK